jgi:hypothetical protein
VIAPEDNELEIGDKSNYDEDQHVDVPLEAKVEQNLSVA